MHEISYTISQLTKEYLNELVELEKACFSQAWNTEQFSMALENEHYLFFGLTVDKVLVSYIALQYIPSSPIMQGGEYEVLNIASYEQYRRKGFAKNLLKHILNLGKENFIESIFLEVRESNIPAKKLYTKLGFQEIGRRKNYYKTEKGQEDALIMKFEFASL